MIRTRPNAHCCLCGTPGTILYENLRDYLFDAPGVWTMKQCPVDTCGLIWLDPFPLTEDISLAYTSYYTHDSVSSGWAVRMRGLLFNCYRFAHSLPGRVTGLHQERTDIAHMYLKDLTPGRLLDVGCGDGLFLNRMRQRGWKVDGCDFDPAALKSARTKYGLELRLGDVKSIALPSGSLDAITLYHVVEHVPDPIEVFAECWRLLTPGGRLVMATPNSLSDGHARFKACWRGLEPPRHLHLFSPHTLAECARRTQFEVLSAKSTAANADVISGTSFSISEAKGVKLGTNPRLSVSRTIKSWLFQQREHRRARSGLDCGEEAVLICRKPNHR